MEKVSRWDHIITYNYHNYIILINYNYSIICNYLRLILKSMCSNKLIVHFLILILYASFLFHFQCIHLVLLCILLPLIHFHLVCSLVVFIRSGALRAFHLLHSSLLTQCRPSGTGGIWFTLAGIPNWP